MRRRGRYSYAEHFYAVNQTSQALYNGRRSKGNNPVDTCTRAAVEAVAQTQTAKFAAKAVNAVRGFFRRMVGA